jgi:predicted metal-dependent hydrolase
VTGEPLDTARCDERLDRVLREGVSLFNRGRFFQCHEVLEEVWLQEEGESKVFLQGIIKIAAAFHHFKKGTYRGMLDLLVAGRETLAPFRPSYRGLELSRFLEAIDSWIPRARELLRGGEVDEATIPSLRYTSEEGR